MRPVDAAMLIRRIAEAVLTLVDSADGAGIALAEGDGSVRLVGVAGMLTQHVGAVFDGDGSVAGVVTRSGRPALSDDVESDPRVGHEVALRLGIRSLVHVPLMHGPSPIGVMMLTATRPSAFTDADVRRGVAAAGVVGLLVAAAGELTKLADDFVPCADLEGCPNSDADVEAVARFIADLADPAMAGLSQLRKRVEGTIRDEAMDIVVQPIVDLSSGAVVAFEALSRFTGQPVAPPDRWFGDAQHVGLGAELELCTARKALRLVPDLPGGAILAVNVGPAALCDPRFAAMLEVIDPCRIVVEITEHLPVTDYHPLVKAFDALRARGVRLSVDDAGAGYASFAHIVELSPEFIKLDRSLIAGIDVDPVRQALAMALVTFSHAAGSQVVAEGIETAAELATVARLDIGYGQGFYLGRPAPPADYFSLVVTAIEVAPAHCRRPSEAPVGVVQRPLPWIPPPPRGVGVQPASHAVYEQDGRRRQPPPGGDLCG